DLTDDIRRGPCDREYAEGCRPKQAGNEKCEDAAEIRREHRDRVQERAAFQFHSGLVDPRWPVYYRRLCLKRRFEPRSWFFASWIADVGNFKIRWHMKAPDDSCFGKGVSIQETD